MTLREFVRAFRYELRSYLATWLLTMAFRVDAHATFEGLAYLDNGHELRKKLDAIRERRA